MFDSKSLKNKNDSKLLLLMQPISNPKFHTSLQNEPQTPTITKKILRLDHQNLEMVRFQVQRRRSAKDGPRNELSFKENIISTNVICPRNLLSPGKRKGR